MGMARFQISFQDIFANCSFVSFLFAPVLLEFFLCWSFAINNFDYILFCKARTKFNIYSNFYGEIIIRKSDTATDYFLPLEFSFFRNAVIFLLGMLCVGKASISSQLISCIVFPFFEFGEVVEFPDLRLIGNGYLMYNQTT